MIPQVSVHGVCVGATLPLLLYSIKAVGAAAARAAKATALFRSSLIIHNHAVFTSLVACTGVATCPVCVHVERQ